MVLAHHLLGNLFEQTFEGYPAPTLIVDREVRIILANRAARAVVGEGPDGLPILRMRGGDVLHCIRSFEPGGCGQQALCEDCVIRRSVRLAYEHQTVQRCRADLEVRRGSKVQPLHVLVSASPIDHDGERQVVLTLEDITEVVELSREATQAEREARELEARLATVVDNLAEGVVVATMAGEVLHWNPAALTMHGFQSVEEGRRWLPEFANLFEAFDSDGRRLDLGEWALSRILRGETIRDMEIRVRRLDQGWERIWRANGSLVRNPLGEPLMAVVTLRDVTDERALQAEVALAARLASVGTLVAGVAHEVNNPLAGNLANVTMATETLQDVVERLRGRGTISKEEAADLLVEALDQLVDARVGANRIAHVVRDLSLIGRPGVRRVRTQLVDVVQGAVRWAKASVEGSAALTVRSEGNPVVMAAGGQLEQVFLNLITNAASAVPSDRVGQITITVGHGAKGMARVEVADNGIGMLSEMVAKIFDPFFTTREVGAGMGLGLPVCRSIVMAHGGTMQVSSKVGAGSVFRVEMPLAKKS